MHLVGNACAFASEQQCVCLCKGKVGVVGRGVGRQQDQTPAAGGVELPECFVADDRHVVEVIQAGTPQRAVSHIEPCRTNHINRHAKTGGKPQNRTGILRNVWLVECEPHMMSVRLIFANCRAATLRQIAPELRPQTILRAGSNAVRRKASIFGL
jgi:hypothetical protein